MVRLDCIKDGCSYLTQNLPFDQAEKILTIHLNRKHPINQVSLAPSLPNLRKSPLSPIPKLNRLSRSVPSSPVDQGFSLVSETSKAELFTEIFGTERLTKDYNRTRTSMH